MNYLLHKLIPRVISRFKFLAGWHDSFLGKNFRSGPAPTSFDRFANLATNPSAAGDGFKASAIAAAAARATRLHYDVTYLSSTFAETAIQLSVYDQSAADARADKYTYDVPCPSRCAGSELTIQPCVHVVLHYRRRTKLFSESRTEWEVLEPQIRCFDYVAGIKIDRARRADANRCKLRDSDTCVFESSMTDVRDRCEDLFVITPCSGFRTGARDDATVGIKHGSQHLCSAQIYA
jgi:hypothetical protein